MATGQTGQALNVPQGDQCARNLMLHASTRDKASQGAQSHSFFAECHTGIPTYRRSPLAGVGSATWHVGLARHDVRDKAGASDDSRRLRGGSRAGTWGAVATRGGGPGVLGH